jgi:VIT1/CCC1 family predicted Fe2+/Mn2+ transporter
VTFGLYNIFYIEVLDPEFMTKYADHAIANQSVGKSADEIMEIRQSVTSEMEMFDNPAIQFVLMFLSVFIMGAIVSLISGFFVKKSSGPDVVL